MRANLAKAGTSAGGSAGGDLVGAYPNPTLQAPMIVALTLTGDSIWVVVDSQGQVFAPAFDVSPSGVTFLAGA